MLQVKRAREIIDSTEKIGVAYNGTPVWLESVRDTDETAYVTVLGTCSTMEVPVNELVETGPAE